MKKLTAIQQIVERYKTIRGYHKVPNWDQIHFTRHVRAAKTLLDQAGNYSEAIHALETLSKYFKDKKLDYTIDTIIRRYPDLVAHNLRDSDDRAMYYIKLSPKIEQEQNNKNLEELRKLKMNIIKKIEKHHDDDIEE